MENYMQVRNIGDEEAQRKGIVSGWWGVDEDGRALLGPYPSREAVLLAMADRGLGEPAGEEPVGALGRGRKA
jgi:hypothetical protein